MPPKIIIAAIKTPAFVPKKQNNIFKITIPNF